MESTPSHTSTARVPPEADRSEWTRVIVLAPGEASPAANAELPEALRDEFERRDWFAVVHHDPYLAMAELALRERAQAARAAWGLQRMEGLALVVIEPERWPAALVQDLLSALRRWLPAASLWTVTDRRIESAPPSADAALATGSKRPPVADMAALLASLPREEMSGSAPNGASPVDEARGGAGSTQMSQPGRLSREELDMLLAPDDAAADEAGGSEARP